MLADDVVQMCELTEHHLQSHQTAHKVVEVDGHVSVRVAGHQQLVDGVVEGEACRMTGSPSSQMFLDLHSFSF